jgi:hypothetical protein
MNKEIGRKITSLTLLSILLASGGTFAMPGAIPVAEAAHNANLFVSAENSQFSNYFAGPQVIEVVVNDNDIRSLDDDHGEPDVTVNGNKLRMAQTTDGNWYGYFASRVQAQAADATQGATSGEGLDFGEFCDETTSATILGVSYSQTVGVSIRKDVATEATNGNTAFVACTTALLAGGATLNHVVRENKTLNLTPPSTLDGQIGVAVNTWPTIQLYDISVGGNVVVTYNKGGGSQTTTLTFDTIPSNVINTVLDRATYPLSAQVHVTMTDPQLSIDPTDEDSWTWDTDGETAGKNRLFYQLFDENGAADVLTSAGSQDLLGNLTTLMFEKNGKVTVDTDAQGAVVVAFGDNDDEVFTTAVTPNTGGAFSQLMTFVELTPKGGVLANYDESDNANLDVTATAERGKSATLRYNDVSKSIVVGFGFGSIDINAPDGEWNSGEEIPVTLVDSDANKNSRADEDLDLNDPSVALIPTLKIGNPFTLQDGADFAIVGRLSTATDNSTARFTINTALAATKHLGLGPEAVSEVQTFSQRAILNTTFPAYTNGTVLVVNNPPGTSNADSALIVDLESGTTQKTLKNLRDALLDTTTTGGKKGINLFNYDLRSLNNTGAITKVDAYLLVNVSASTTANEFVIGAESATTTGTCAAADGFGCAADDTSEIRAISIANATANKGLIAFNTTSGALTAAAVADITLDAIYRGTGTAENNAIGLMFLFNQTGNFTINVSKDSPIVADFFSVGISGDGFNSVQRTNNAIYRFELEETGDNTSTFIGTAEFTMLNQLNIFDIPLYTALRTIDDEVTFIVHDDSDDEDSPRINYADLGQDGGVTFISDQQAAGTHSGVVSFDKDTYKLGDTVTVTLEDADLNVDSDLIDIYVTVAPAVGEGASDTVGEAGLGSYSNGDAFGRLMDITFDDGRWVKGGTGNTCDDVSATLDDGLDDAGFSLIETGTATGVFNGDFLLPADYCNVSATPDTRSSVTGVDIEVNYVDFRDASGQVIEVGDGAGVRASTGSVSLDRTIYPVPFGKLADFGGTTGDTTSGGFSVFPVHVSGVGTEVDDPDKTLAEGDLTVIIRVTDPDFDISFVGEDVINVNTTDTLAGAATNARGPVKVSVSRGSSEVTLAYAGGPAALVGTIDVGDNSPTTTVQLGPMTEIAPDAGIFETELVLLYTDGPADASCPATTSFTATDGGGALESDRFDFAAADGTEYCILQGDIITVEYTDPTDASGDTNTVTDSATFDLRNGVLQSDKSVYIIGADMIMTLIEPDLDLDSDTAESYDLDLIEWDSDADTLTMGDLGLEAAAFDPEPSDFRETGDNTGIFQVVIEIPNTLGGARLDRGEEIELEYTDWGPSGADFVGDEDEDINLTIYTSNFGATVELDQKVYTWTDKVFITIVAPDHNFDSNLIDEIGDTSIDQVTVATRGDKLKTYKLVETGTDTGIFTGEVILTGFSHDADGDTTTGAAGIDTDPRTSPASGGGPTNGFLKADDDDGLTVSFEFTEDETVVGSALIRWNIGEVQFLEASYPATGQGVLRVVDPDLNLNPEAVDNFDVDVWSDSDAGGIDLTVTETNEATGIFEGTVYFTVTDESSGHRLRVAEGDTVTGEYEDNTLPSPYTTADEIEVTATTFIGTVVPPLERAPASNPRVVDAFGNELDEVSVDQQVQITADLANGQDRDQPFAYLVQISKDGVTHSLSWITGSLAPGQSLNPAQSWTPTEAGTYDVQIFVWESVDNPDALSPPVETTVTVV